jgi:acetyl esterase/lipase
VQTAWGQPSGSYTGRPPRALLILLPGGGWRGPDRAAFAATVASSQVFQGFGYGTLTVNYRRGEQGIEDVARSYREARRRVGPRLPICAIGSSAGGHVALMLAVVERDVACVIDIAGPTDLAALARQPNGRAAAELAADAFGRDRLAALSPARHASRISAHVLVVLAEGDPLVPVSQGRRLATRKPGVRVIVLPRGRVPYIHSEVDPRAKAAADRAELRFLERTVARSAAPSAR